MMTVSTQRSRSGGAGTVTGIHEARAAADDIWGPVLKQVADRDRAAFSRLFQHFAPQIKAFGLSTVINDRSGQFADELVQEVMITIWHKAASYDAAKAAASTWIFTIARNKRIDLLRKLKRQPVSVDVDEIWPIEDESAGPFRQLQQRVTQQRIRDGLDDLPAAQREVLVMAYMEGLSHSEIAEHLGLPLGTVKSRIRLAMQRLQLSINRQDY